MSRTSDSRKFMLRIAQAPTECNVCGDSVAKGASFAELTGALNRRTGRPITSMKFCGLCSGLYMPKPDNWEVFFNPATEPTARECLEIIDAGLCDSSCILAKDDGDDCECRCDGGYHGSLRMALALIEASSMSNDVPANREDVAALASLDPPAATVREARSRLGWNNARTVRAMREWRDATDDQAIRNGAHHKP